jgi:NADH:ubiquinone oxidoreductase subunit 5 (subunit L)/multisubunit Na+/H+ antiporter MnhA subunit
MAVKRLGLYKSRVLLYMLLANILIIVFGPFLLYSLDIEIYRLLAPYIGRGPATILEAVLSIGIGLLWIYFWRKSFMVFFGRLLEQKTSIKQSL